MSDMDKGDELDRLLARSFGSAGLRRGARGEH